ncbi:hypothetical protein IMY05_006G0222700 [Salix suchowensis]|nr:hypothetical protein IMY05_006G0222700 [Salix suchowensis]
MMVKNSLQFNKMKSSSTCGIPPHTVVILPLIIIIIIIFYHTGYRIIGSFPLALNCCWLSWVGY